MIYVYALVDPRDKAVKYIGRTQNCKARLSNHISNARPRNGKAKHAWIKLLKRAGLLPEMIVLQECNRRTAAAAEARWIAKHSASGTLLNVHRYSKEPEYRLAAFYRKMRSERCRAVPAKAAEQEASK